MGSKGPEAALQFWEAHLDKLNKMIGKNKADLSYTKADALKKYAELEREFMATKDIIYKK